ncbi:MAG: cupin domain-containing protein [bacterium]|nr:cupin domain-containing protein [bacterium]
MKSRTSPVVRPTTAARQEPVGAAKNTQMQVLLGPEDGAPNFVTRRFVMDPGGRIPCHRHDRIEHEQVILEGEMVIGLDDREYTVRSGDCVLIPAGVAHWYENRSIAPTAFLCVVPLSSDYQTEWIEPPENA